MRVALWVLFAVCIAASACGQDLAQAAEKLPITQTQRVALQQSIANRDYKSAERLLVHQIELAPSSRDVIVFAARLFMLDRDPVNAAIAFAKAEKIQPLEPADRFSLAMAYIGIHRPQWAREELNKLAAADPQNTGTQYWLARLDYDDRQYDSAVRRFEAVVKAEPELGRAWDNLGLSLEGAGKLDQALQSYARGVELNRKTPKPSAWPPLNMGILLTRLDRAAEAEPLLREAVQNDPNLAAARYRLGVSLQKQEKYGEALQALRRAVELDARDPGPWYPLSQIYRKQGEIAAADAALQRFRALKKENNASVPRADERNTGSPRTAQHD